MVTLSRNFCQWVERYVIWEKNIFGWDWRKHGERNGKVDASFNRQSSEVEITCRCLNFRELYVYVIITYMNRACMSKKWFSAWKRCFDGYFSPNAAIVGGSASSSASSVQSDLTQSCDERTLQTVMRTKSEIREYRFSDAVLLLLFLVIVHWVLKPIRILRLPEGVVWIDRYVYMVDLLECCVQVVASAACGSVTSHCVWKECSFTRWCFLFSDCVYLDVDHKHKRMASSSQLIWMAQQHII